MSSTTTLSVQGMTCRHAWGVARSVGINDAPALTAAAAGIAIGTGTDIAIEAGDVVLVRGDPRSIADALRLARRTLRTVRQNFFWAYAYNVALVPLAALALVSPVLAAAAMSASSLFVLGNSLRLKRASSLVSTSGGTKRVTTSSRGRSPVESEANMNTFHARQNDAATLFGGSGPDETREGRAWLDEPAVPNVRIRLVVSAVLTAQLIGIAILGHGTRVAWLELALATPIVGWAALPFYDRAVSALRRRRANMFALASLGILTAYVYSLVATLAPGIHGGRTLYFAAAGSTVTLVLLGEFIERWVRKRASAEIGDVSAVRRALSPTTTIEDVADRISAAIVPAALAISALTFLGWMLLGPSPKVAHAIEATVAVLVIACPAAIALASPLSFLMATAAAKRDGIHLRDPKLTDTLARVTTLVLDRTGVLTEGTPTVLRVEAAPGFDQAELLRLAAAAEYECEHPVARAVVAHAKEEDEDGPRSIRRPVAGRGVVAEVRGRDVVLGAHALLSARGVEIPADALGRAEELRRSGASVTFAGIDGRYAGLVAIGDCAREDAREAILALRRMGVRVAMMTGSSRTLGRSVARQLDLHDGEVFAAVHPDDRARMIERFRARGETVAVAGRHVASASAAHVGLAFGSSDHADVSLPNGDLHSIVRMIHLARRTVRNVRQNLVLAVLYNLLAIPVAAVTGMSPLAAACVMGLGTLSVLGSSLRLLRTGRGK